MSELLRHSPHPLGFRSVARALLLIAAMILIVIVVLQRPTGDNDLSVSSDQSSEPENVSQSEPATNVAEGNQTASAATAELRVEIWPPYPTPTDIPELLTTSRLPLYDETLRIYATFSRPQFCMLLELNPLGNIAPLSPSDPGQSMEMPIEVLRFPDEGNEFIGLDDGVGQQALLLLHSDRALPSFDTLMSEIGELSWRPDEEVGHWQFADGYLFPGGSKVRSSIRKAEGAEDFAAACRKIESAMSGAAVNGVSFPVTRQE